MKTAPYTRVMPLLLRALLSLAVLVALAVWTAAGLGFVPAGALPFRVERWSFAASAHRPSFLAPRVDPTFEVDPEREFRGQRGKLFRLVTAGKGDFYQTLPDHVLLTDEVLSTSERWGTRRRLLPRMQRGSLYDQGAYWYEEDDELVLIWHADVPVLTLITTEQPDGTRKGRADARTCMDSYILVTEIDGERYEERKERPRARPYVTLEPLGEWPR